MIRFDLRHYFIAALAISSTLLIDNALANEHVADLCEVSFAKETMPKDEVALFCSCVAADVGPRLSTGQNSLVGKVADSLRPGSPGVPKSLLEQVASSGVRDLIVAAQARCSDALYSSRDYIELRSDDGAELALYCDLDRVIPVASFGKDGLRFATEDEIESSLEAIIMGTGPDSAYTVVEFSWSADGGPKTVEYWDVNLAGDGADAEVAGKLLQEVRFADRLNISVRRGNTKYSGQFNVSKKIPPLWRPCSVR